MDHVRRVEVANLLFAFELDRRSVPRAPMPFRWLRTLYAATNLFSNLNPTGRRPTAPSSSAPAACSLSPRPWGRSPSLMAATMLGLPGGSLLSARAVPRHEAG